VYDVRLFTVLLGLHDYSLIPDLENMFSNAHNMMNICDKFYSNPPTNYGDIASSEIYVNGQRTDGGTTRQHYALRLVVVWRSGSALVFINEVNVRRVWLILGWVTDRDICLGT